MSSAKRSEEERQERVRGGRVWGQGPLSSYFFHRAVVISKGLAQNGNEGPLVSNVIGMSRWGG